VIRLELELEREELEALEAAYMTVNGERLELAANPGILADLMALAARFRVDDLIGQGRRRLHTMSLEARGEIEVHRASVA